MYNKTLYRLTKLDQIQVFHIWVDGLTNTLHSSKGHLGGAQQEDAKIFHEGKNIGRANETSAYEQAISEAKSMFNKLLDKGYKEEPFNIETADDRADLWSFLKKHQGKDASGNLRPMLAQKKLKITKWPVYVQRKYDGIRSFSRMDADGDIHVTSRNGKEFDSLDHIKESLKLIYPYDKNVGIVNDTDIIDGELFTTSTDFQGIVSAVKRKQESSKRIKLRVYDIGCNLPQSYRMGLIMGFREELDIPNIEFVETFICSTMEKILEYHAQFIAEGYEGTMVRTMDGRYEYGKRSWSLMKYKDFDEDEFELIGMEEATGRDAGTAIFVLSDGKVTFRARPMGDRDVRAALWDDQHHQIGRMVTVKYQGKSNTGVPRFPVAKGFRDYE